jgi:molybdate transport system ATP-binding protein
VSDPISASLRPVPGPGSERSALTLDGAVQRGGFRLEVDITVEPGEVLGVIGPNGSGKTTLLRTLAGLTPLAEGRVCLGEQVLDSAEPPFFVAPEQRPIGFVFQNYRLFPHLSVRDNVAFAPRCRRTGRRQSRLIADEWLNRLGLSDLATRKPPQLSGGQAQRVALARALAADPGVLLLDEPLAALDAKTKLEIRAELRRHLTEFPGATLLVTHDPLEAMVMTDRLVVIENGRIVQRGEPAAVARRPATQYVARLVGLNLYHGVLDDSGRVVLDDAAGTLIATHPLPADAATPGRVLVAIRPTAIAVHTVRPDHFSPRNVWAGTVTGLELLTDRVRAQVSGTPSALVDLTPDAVADLGLAEGRPVWLSAKATDLDIYPDTQ